ncbi:MAG: hypothetical protein HN348_03815, partial [Proteobacteria bacterium]|nr:hypothetical protein [Pseudomonadota bacterium]
QEDGAISAVRVLGEVGSVRAVEPLLKLTKGGLPSALKQESRQAVRAIQSRLENVEAGRLSMAPIHGGGELSVAAEEGRLAIAHREGRKA